MRFFVISAGCLHGAGRRRQDVLCLPRFLGFSTSTPAVCTALSLCCFKPPPGGNAPRPRVPTFQRGRPLARPSASLVSDRVCLSYRKRATLSFHSFGPCRFLHPKNRKIMSIFLEDKCRVRMPCSCWITSACPSFVDSCLSSEPIELVLLFCVKLTRIRRMEVRLRHDLGEPLRVVRRSAVAWWYSRGCLNGVSDETRVPRPSNGEIFTIFELSHHGSPRLQSMHDA